MDNFGQPVNPANISKALAQLWQDDTIHTRASLINLAIYSETPGSLPENQKIVQFLTREHACRAILIELDRSQSEVATEAWIDAICNLDNKSEPTCSDQIIFRLSGVSMGRLRNTVFSQVDSDLPLVFWWQGELSPTFEPGLYSAIDRLVFDSSHWIDPIPNYKRIMRAKHERGARLQLNDLEWTRTRSVRVAIAGLFDDPPALSALPEICHATIFHHPNHRCAALHTLAWLATQAGWCHFSHSSSENLHTFQTARPNDSVTAEILPASDASAPIARIILQTRSGKTLTVTTRPETSCITIAHNLTDAPFSSSAILDACDPASLLATQLSRPNGDFLFSRVNPTFLALLHLQQLKHSSR